MEKHEKKLTSSLTWPENCAWPELVPDTPDTPDTPDSLSSKKSGASRESNRADKAKKTYKASNKDTEAISTLWTAEDYDILRDYVLTMLDVLHYYQELVEEGWLDKDYKMTDEALFMSTHDILGRPKSGMCSSGSDESDESESKKDSQKIDNEGDEDSNINENRENDEDNEDGDVYKDCWQPEMGREYWADNRFNFKAWQRDFSANTKTLKLATPNPVGDIENAIGGYAFINENLLRQAFTRKSFALEHGVGSSQELEFLGDIVLNAIVTKEIIKSLTRVDSRNVKSPFLTGLVSIQNQTAKGSNGSNQEIEAIEYIESIETVETEKTGNIGKTKKAVNAEKTAVNIINTRDLRQLRELNGQKVATATETLEATEVRSLNEGDLTKLRSKFVNKEYLSSRAKALDLEQYILYGSKEEPSVSALEDLIEALIGAVAIDTNWDWEILTEVVGHIINLQLDDPDSLLAPTYFDLFNNWHQRRWGCMPKYSIHQIPREKSSGKRSSTEKSSDDKSSNEKSNNKPKPNFYCMIHYFTLNSYDGEKSETSAGSKGETRSEAREKVAKYAYKCVERAGLLEKNIKRDSGITPDFETSINQIQELKQKKYIKDVEYYFFTDGKDREEDYICSCFCEQAFESFNGFGKDANKRKAKKLAAFDALNALFQQASQTSQISTVNTASTLSTASKVSTVSQNPPDSDKNRRSKKKMKESKSKKDNQYGSGNNTRLKILTFLKDTDSDIYRIISVSDSATLDDLCYYILEAFDFDHDHLYTFTAKGDIYICEEGDLDKPWTTDITLSELGLKKGDSLLLRYDFGDNWWFVINVIDVIDAIEIRKDNSDSKRDGYDNEDFEVLQGRGEIEQYPDFEF